MIVALAGRRIDAPGAQPSRFPPSLVDSVKKELIACFKSADAKHLVCSGACGADLVALQAAGELGISKTMVLPFDAATFKSTSVTDRPGNWGAIYDDLVTELRLSNALIELNHDKNDPEVYINTNFSILDEAQKIAGLKRIESGFGSLESGVGTYANKIDDGSLPRIVAVIVWEGKPKDEDDTTYHFMKEAKKRNFMIKEIICSE